jgi:hypothetical protein
VGNVLLARQLPTLNEGIIEGSLQDHGATQIIEATRETSVGNLVPQVSGRFHAVTVQKYRGEKKEGVNPQQQTKVSTRVRQAGM